MDRTQLVVFNKENAREILTDLEFKIQRKKISENNYSEVVVDSDNNPVFCSTCKKEILVKRVGTIAHGSRLLFCENPLCFATWIANNKIR